MRSDQKGNAHSLHAISSIPITTVASQQIRKAKINSLNNRDQFRDHPTPLITRDCAITCTTTSLALCSCTAPRPHILVPGPRATFAIAHAVRRSTPLFNRALSTSCLVPAPSCPRRLATLPANAGVPCHNVELATSTHQVRHQDPISPFVFPSSYAKRNT